MELGELRQAPMFPACVRRDPALHWGKSSCGEGSGGFPAEGWCRSLSVAARGCPCVKNCQNGVCVLGVPGTPLGKAGSLGAGAFALKFLPLGPSGVFTLLLFFTFKCLRTELCPSLSIPVISPLSQ